MALTLVGVEPTPMMTVTTTGKAVSPDKVLISGRTGMKRQRMITSRALRQEMRDLLLPRSTRITSRRRGVKDHPRMASLLQSQDYSHPPTRSGARSERSISCGFSFSIDRFCSPFGPQQLPISFHWCSVLKSHHRLK